MEIQLGNGDWVVLDDLEQYLWDEWKWRMKEEGREGKVVEERVDVD